MSSQRRITRENVRLLVIYQGPEICKPSSMASNDNNALHFNFYFFKGAPLWLEKKEMLQFDDFRVIKETENAQEGLQLTLNHTVKRSFIFNMNI